MWPSLRSAVSTFRSDTGCLTIGATCRSICDIETLRFEIRELSSEIWDLRFYIWQLIFDLWEGAGEIDTRVWRWSKMSVSQCEGIRQHGGVLRWWRCNALLQMTLMIIFRGSEVEKKPSIKSAPRSLVNSDVLAPDERSNETGKSSALTTPLWIKCSLCLSQKP